jgi:hypothetical protein
MTEQRPRSSAAKWIALGILGCAGCGLAVALPPTCVGLLLVRQRELSWTARDAERLAEESLAQACVDPRVTRALGEPVRTRGRRVSVRHGVRGSELEAVFELEGPAGTGELRVRAERRYGAWQVREARFEELRRHAIDLLDAGGGR